MDKNKIRLFAGFLLSLSLLDQGNCQQNTIFNQNPFQRRQQTPQLGQQLQQQQQRQVFPNTLPVLNPPISPLNTLSPISPLGPQQGIFRNYNQVNPENYVPITAYQNELNYDGSFSYGYAAGDGTTAQAQGYVKNLGYGDAVEAQVVQGSYSYTSPEGTPITVHYIADENGFRAEGSHLPTQPFQNFVNPNLNPNLNPYQQPFRQGPTPPTLLPGQQLNPLQQELQQQQQRAYQQQNTGQYQPGGGQINRLQNQFGSIGFQQQFPGGGQQFGPGGLGFGSNLSPQQQQQFNQQNLTQQQQNLQQQQQAEQQQQNQLQQQQNQLRQQQQQQQQQQQNLQNQQQLATQELRGRPDQFVSPFGFNPYRRFKKAATKK